MINVFYTEFNSPLTDVLWNDYLACLPYNLQEKVLKYRKWQDRQANLFGKLLLIKGLKYYGYGNQELEQIQYNDYGKPYLDINLKFNISHSGKFVICSISDLYDSGIDIEEIIDLQIADFKNSFSASEWMEIIESESSINKFYEFWTIKEAVAKAEGKGLSLPLADLVLKNSSVKVFEKTWHILKINLDPGYSASIATDTPLLSSGLKLTKVIF